ncbi:MAG: hypothetical protein IT491_08550 [Gammaproteobacteria bacterium]|nr:hypothetical protein [Gammaproteobacteria bacterium]
MQFKKSSLALAVAAGLVVGNANAVVDLSASPIVPAGYASELLSANAVLANPGVAAGPLALTGKIGWGVAAGSHLYIRINLTNGQFATTLTAVDFTTVPAPLPAAPPVLSAGGAAGSTYVIYDVTGPFTVGAAPPNTFTLAPPAAAALRYVNPAQPITATVKFYTDSTLAATDGTALATLTGTYAVASSALTTTFIPDTSVATVVSDYKLFGANAAGGLGAGKVAHLGQMTTALNVALNTPAGLPVAAPALATNSTLVLNGLFSAVGTTGSISAVAGAAPAANCTAGLVPGALNADKTTATFTNLGTALLADVWQLCFTADGVTEIPVQTVAGTLTFTGQVPPAVIPAVTGTVGTITHDGTRLVAPLVQVPPTASPTRLVLNNTNAVDYPYTVTALTEEGVTATLTGAAKSGTLKAGQTTVIDLGGLITVTGGTSGALRTGLKVTSTAPVNTITGYYILLNSNGVVSNFLLNPVR